MTEISATGASGSQYPIDDGKPKAPQDGGKQEFSIFDKNKDGIVTKEEMADRLRIELANQAPVAASDNMSALGYISIDAAVEELLKDFQDVQYDASTAKATDKNLFKLMSVGVQATYNVTSEDMAQFANPPAEGPAKNSPWGMKEEQWNYVFAKLAEKGVKVNEEVNNRLNEIFNQFNAVNMKRFNGVLNPLPTLDGNWDHTITADEVATHKEKRSSVGLEQYMNHDANGNVVDTHVLDYIVNVYMASYPVEKADKPEVSAEEKQAAVNERFIDATYDYVSQLTSFFATLKDYATDYNNAVRQNNSSMGEIKQLMKQLRNPKADIPSIQAQLIEKLNAYTSQIEAAIVEAAGNQGAQSLSDAFANPSDDFVAKTGRESAEKRVLEKFDKSRPSMENIAKAYDIEGKIEDFHNTPWLGQLK